MFNYFLPKEEIYFDYFEKHAVLIVKASRSFFEIVSAPTFHEDGNPIKSLEHEADEIVHECLKALHKTFITPIDREAIYQLMSSMDDIIDSINTAYNCLVMYKLNQSTDALKTFAKLVVEGADYVEQIIKELRNIHDPEKIARLGIQIHQIENKADDLYYQATAHLFDTYEDAREIIKWKDVYRAMEDATDFCEDVADAVQSIVLENI
ncbi:MAG: hypothetical protein BGO14_00370 [Chlamydiales bacterium 38-26]|nr:DUF47 domain-containing protein [Chlamydiales bacterium]OJV07180.1 MAG: hypothetical protein BGO14_00370 [Chlamydiales bacterium 38-26]